MFFLSLCCFIRRGAHILRNKAALWHTKAIQLFLQHRDLRFGCLLFLQEPLIMGIGCLLFLQESVSDYGRVGCLLFLQKPLVMGVGCLLFLQRPMIMGVGCLLFLQGL